MRSGATSANGARRVGLGVRRAPGSWLLLALVVGCSAPPVETTASRQLCEVIATILREDGWKPELEEATVENPLEPRSRPGCRVFVTAPTTLIAEGGAPAERVHRRLVLDGWREDSRYAADGPGTTAFSLHKAGIVCFFAAGAPSALESGEIVTAERYTFEAGCVEDEP